MLGLTLLLIIFFGLPLIFGSVTTKQPRGSKDKSGLSVLVTQDQIPEIHRLKSLSLAAADSDSGVRLNAVGSIRKIIVKVDTSGVSFTGGTSPALVTRAADLFLKQFKITFDDAWFGKREIIGGTWALMTHRNIRKTKKGSSSVLGEFILEFPQRDKFNAMLPAGRSIEFTLDYTCASIAELESSGTAVTAVTGIAVTIEAERFQRVYVPNAAYIYKNRVVSITGTGDKEIEYSNNHLLKTIGFVQYDTSDVLADIANSYKFTNNGREITDLRPASWRAYINDIVGVTPSVGIIYHEPATPLVTDEFIAKLDISDASSVELYAYTEEVMY